MQLTGSQRTAYQPIGTHRQVSPASTSIHWGLPTLLSLSVEVIQYLRDGSARNEDVVLDPDCEEGWSDRNPTAPAPPFHGDEQIWLGMRHLRGRGWGTAFDPDIAECFLSQDVFPFCGRRMWVSTGCWYSVCSGKKASMNPPGLGITHLIRAL